ncbi:tripartite motif-containing protein 26 [Tachyglossus aculeatus]|uniref:tripartite motif-containing protein 26 n=1 Tax=Tachyglossus aculeatus TaxID=9261 RepID=UPI0018F4E995|nr:tripartite motif-containing protein 26 [Tachyglossus aculeatus]
MESCKTTVIGYGSSYCHKILGSPARNGVWLEAERWKVVSMFEVMHQFLEGQECLLGKLEELEQDVRKGQEELVASVFAELAQLKTLISELEEKSQQEEAELLEGITGSLNRFQGRKFLKWNTISQEMERRMSGLSGKITFLQKNVKKFQGKLLRELESNPACPSSDLPKIVRTSELHFLQSNNASWFPETHFHVFLVPCNLASLPTLPTTRDTPGGLLATRQGHSPRLYLHVDVGESPDGACTKTRAQNPCYAHISDCQWS